MIVFPAVMLATKRLSDREFMKMLYVEHRVTMFRMARALTDSNQDAEDAVSEACVSLMRKVTYLRQCDRNVVEAYVVSTVKNSVYSLYRKQKKKREVTDGDELLPLLPDPAPTPDSRVIEQCTIETLMSAIEQLPEEDQVALRMKYFEKRTCREIAEVLGIQESNVRVRLSRARKRIYELVGEDLK